LRGGVLEEVAVVAPDLDDEAVAGEAEPLGHLVRVAARVLDPARRVRGEVRVIGEDLLRTDVLLELDEEAAVADPDVQGEEGLLLVRPLRRHEALAERLRAEVDERVLERGAAEATRCANA